MRPLFQVRGVKQAVYHFRYVLFVDKVNFESSKILTIHCSAAQFHPPSEADLHSNLQRKHVYLFQQLFIKNPHQCEMTATW